MQSLKRFWQGVSRTLKILRDPVLRGETREVFERMKQDGVDPADAAARQSWVRAHRRDLRRLQGRTPPAPVARTDRKIGRNVPCRCGSGKKYKKCCGASL